MSKRYSFKPEANTLEDPVVLATFSFGTSPGLPFSTAFATTSPAVGTSTPVTTRAPR